MDYYSILGVSKNASEQDLKKAYKKMSMKHHPDRGGDEAKFKEVNEAYSTLKDPKKRAEYDNPQPQFRYNSSNFNGFADMGGGHPFSDIFGEIHRRQRRNRDVTINVKLDLLDVMHGKELTAKYQVPSGRVKEANIDIPAGIEDGTGIRFRGLGDDAIPNIQPGDLIVRVKIKNPLNWNRSGNDLRTRVTVSIFECMLGGSTEITTLEGKKLKLNIPKGTQPGAIFSIPNHGIPNIQRGNRGSIFVEINAIVPKIENEMILTELERIKNALS
jgi:curved DNA-binding protein